ncbi:MAG: diacylglycerol kinase family protein [Patescibacteria group bacterium]
MVNLIRLAKSFRHAWRGLIHTLFYHQNLRIHLTVAVVAAVLGLYFQISSFEWFGILVAIFLVLVAEMINTSLEEITNLVKEDHHERARIAKDVSAGMVLLATIFAILVGLAIFLPRFF